jgi:AcrR family transcriptional regulator
MPRTSTAAVKQPARAPRAARKKATAQPEPAPRYHHGNLREELVRCGKVMLEQVGLADLSLRQIAAEVGVSQVAPKHHFGNKEGLLAAIAASGFRDLTEYRFSKIKPQMNAEQRFRSLLASYVQFAMQNPALFHLMFAPHFKTPQLHAELNDAASQSYQIVLRAAGEFLAEIEGSAGLSADEAARIAWMCMHGVATLLVENRFNPVGAARTGREQLIGRTIDVVFSGLTALRRSK